METVNEVNGQESKGEEEGRHSAAPTAPQEPTITGRAAAGELFRCNGVVNAVDIFGLSPAKGVLLAVSCNPTTHAVHDIGISARGKNFIFVSLYRHNVFPGGPEEAGNEGATGGIPTAMWRIEHHSGTCFALQWQPSSAVKPGCVPLLMALMGDGCVRMYDLERNIKPLLEGASPGAPAAALPTLQIASNIPIAVARPEGRGVTCGEWDPFDPLNFHIGHEDGSISFWSLRDPQSNAMPLPATAALCGLEKTAVPGPSEADSASLIQVLLPIRQFWPFRAITEYLTKPRMEHAVTSIAAHPTLVHLIATAHRDGALHLWNIHDTTQPLASHRVAGDAVRAIQWLPSGRAIQCLLDSGRYTTGYFNTSSDGEHTFRESITYSTQYSGFASCLAPMFSAAQPGMDGQGVIATGDGGIHAFQLSGKAKKSKGSPLPHLVLRERSDSGAEYTATSSKQQRIAEPRQCAVALAATAAVSVGCSDKGEGQWRMKKVNSEVDAIIVAGMGDGSLRGYCTTWSTTKAIENHPGVAIHIDWMNDT